MLVDMYGDLPEDFRNMRDCQNSYNRPLDMRRSEMGICMVKSRKKRRDLPGCQQRQGHSARVKRGGAIEAGKGDHNLG
jgi:hypothetical protein